MKQKSTINRLRCHFSIMSNMFYQTSLVNSHWRYFVHIKESLKNYTADYIIHLSAAHSLNRQCMFVNGLDLESITFPRSFIVCNYFPFFKSFSLFKAPRGSELLIWHPSWARNQYLCSPSNWQYVLHYIHIIDSLYIFSHHKVGLDLSHLSIPRPNSGNTV